MPEILGARCRRRDALAWLLGAGVAAISEPVPAADEPAPLISKPIPASGERLPVIGIGTNAFSTSKREQLHAVLGRMLDLGGRVIDTAPSYGESEQVIGELLAALRARDRVFLATKLTGGSSGATGGRSGELRGAESFVRSLERLRTDHLDLLQVHNLDGLEQLWPQLLAWKRAGKIRYIGTTTASSADHPRLIELMRSYPLDFVQVDYSIANRDAAQNVFSAALERKIAIIANVPLGGRGGSNLLRALQRPLPPFAAQIGISDWAQLMLKYVVSHPAVTCTIAGSTRVEHVEDNQAAGRGRLFDAETRVRIERYWDEAAPT